MSQCSEDLASLIDQVPIGLYRTTEDGTVIAANLTFAKILGFSTVKELLSHNVQNGPQFVSFDRQQFKAELERCGEIRGREFAAKKSDGQTLYFREHVRLVRDTDGKALFYDGSVEEITELRRAKEDLERSDYAYRLLFERHPEPMCIYDLETLAFLEVNDAAILKYGYSRHEFLRMTLWELRPPHEHSRLRACLGLPRDHYMHTDLAVHRLKDGREIDVEITTHDLTFAGRPARVALARDITERLRAKRTLESREAYYRALINNAVDIISIIDESGNILFGSPSLDRALGLAPQDTLGASLLDFIHPDDSAALMQMLRMYRQRKLQNVTIELRFRAEHGEWRVLEARTNNLLDDPNIQGIIINAHDITARTRTEAELKFNRQLLSLAQRAGRVGTWHFDFESGDLQCSPEIMSLFGESPDRPSFSVEEIISRTFEPDRERIKNRIMECVQGRQAFMEVFRIEMPEGGIRWLVAKSEIIHDRDGRPSSLAGVNIDITEQKQVEAALARARDEALDASKTKLQFLATVSHEIRTPMNAIMGLTGLLLDTQLTPEQKNDLEVIRNAAVHLLDLINDTLDLAKAEAGKLALEQSPFDLFETLTAVLDLIGVQAQAKRLSLTYEYASRARRWVVGDSGRVRQIALNFLSNAIKFTSRGGVTLRVDDAPNGHLRISVTDTGVGIPPELASTLFQRFAQGSTASPTQAGTGLGLAISKWLAEAMGGVVGSRNLTKGAEFWVELPLPESSFKGKDSHEPNNDAAFSSRGHRVLLADDNGVNQRVLSRLLEKRGVRAELAADGREAIRMAGESRYDLIFMDCEMPELDGYRAAQEIRRHENPGSRVPIIAVTAHNGESERRRCMDSGMDDYMAKPFNILVLDRILERFLSDSNRGRADTATSPNPNYFESNPTQGLPSRYVPITESESPLQIRGSYSS